MWLGNSKAITQGQSFHYCQLIQALAPTITSLLPYKLTPIESYSSIESILESETQTPITVTDMSQSGILPPAPSMEHMEPEQAPPPPASPANPTPPITVNATQKEVKMNMPTPFTGDRKRLEEFLIETDMYFTMNENTYNNDNQQIIFSLSFMKDGTAGSWKQSFWTQARENNNLGTWDQFKRVLRDSFSTSDKEGDTVTKMETEMMSGQTADEYIEQFKIYSWEQDHARQTISRMVYKRTEYPSPRQDSEPQESTDNDPRLVHHSLENEQPMEERKGNRQQIERRKRHKKKGTAPPQSPFPIHTTHQRPLHDGCGQIVCPKTGRSYEERPLLCVPPTRA